MTSISFANAKPLAVGVTKPTDCGAVLSPGAVESQNTALRFREARLTSRRVPIGAPELAPYLRGGQRPTLSSGIFPRYFPP
jgi:hypothetical protein